MHLIVVSLNFSPEPIGIGRYSGDWCTWLAERGHTITVLTTWPHYPEWQASEKVLPEHSNTGSLTIKRIRMQMGAGASVWTRIRWYAAFARGVHTVLNSGLTNRPAPDAIMLVVPSLLAALPVLRWANQNRVFSWLHVQDFEIDTALSLRMLRLPLAAGLLQRFETALIARFDWATTVSEAMLGRLERLRGARQPSGLMPNWIDWPESQRPDSNITRRLGLPPDARIVLYAGSLGRKQGLELLPLLADRLADQQNVYLVVCGAGPLRPFLVREAASRKRFMVTGLVPEAELPALLEAASVHFLPQLPAVSDLVMPSKLLGMMASGRPVVATALSGSAVAALLNDAGIIVSYDADAAAAAIRLLLDEPDLALRLGQTARARCFRRFSRDRVLTDAEAALLRQIQL